MTQRITLFRSCQVSKDFWDEPMVWAKNCIHARAGKHKRQAAILKSRAAVHKVISCKPFDIPISDMHVIPNTTKVTGLQWKFRSEVFFYKPSPGINFGTSLFMNSFVVHSDPSRKLQACRMPGPVSVKFTLMFRPTRLSK